MVRCADAGFTFTELIVVVVVVSMFVLLGVTNISGLLGRNRFRAQAQDLVSTLQMAADAAAQTDRRYEVVIDLTEQNYTLREISALDLAQVLDEEIILRNDFSESCRVGYVEFDDKDWTNEGRAKFRAGHNGWQYGGKIVLLDSTEKTYSVVVTRLSGIVTLKEGDVDLLEPYNEVPF